MTDVPCNGCTNCCVGLTVYLGADEAAFFPKAREIRKMSPAGDDLGPAWYLPQDAAGRCVYLGRKGCTVHKRKPKVCAEFDCLKWLDVTLEPKSSPRMLERRQAAEARAAR